MINIENGTYGPTGRFSVFLFIFLTSLFFLGGCRSKVSDKTQPGSPQSPSAPARTLRPDSNAKVATTFEQWTGDLDGMIQRRKIRALVVYSKSSFFYDKGHPKGIAYEAMRELEFTVNKKFKTGNRKVVVTFLPTAVAELEQSLLEGRGDLIAWGITVTPERQRRVDFTIPIVTNAKQTIVTGATKPKLGSLQDLSGKKVFVNPLSVSYALLNQLSDSFAKAG